MNLYVVILIISFLIVTHADCIATGVGRVLSGFYLSVCLFVCLFVRALKGKRLELSAPKSV